MRHKILLPTDFSKNSIKAINYAQELYKNEDCDFFLLNVFSVTSSIIERIFDMKPDGELYEAEKLNSENGLAKVYDMLAMGEDNNPKHSFDVISEFNNVVEAINTIVDQKDIEMIIMGTRGETYTKIAALGSTAIYVMEKVRTCPILVVPEDAKMVLPKEIVFPTNYKIHYKRRELQYLINIAKISDAKIIVLHVEEVEPFSENQRENKDLLQDILKGVNYKFHNLSNTSVTTAVNIFVESRESDMVAFINEKHAFFGSVLTNPMVKEISFHLKVPILAMHD